MLPQRRGEIENGKEIYACGDVFEGQWNWEKHVRNGTMEYANGDCYKGQWTLKNGKWLKEGNGLMTYASGETISGKWKNDELNKK
ncbi:MAG: hypothetical protein LBQ28_03055 [Prevotellaceae bacterium]|nr:hypothetical protein [Prevotellaceae bacterium]